MKNPYIKEYICQDVCAKYFTEGYLAKKAIHVYDTEKSCPFCELDLVRAQLVEAEKVIRFYAAPKNWGTVSDNDILEFYGEDEQKCREIDGDDSNCVIGGKRARQYLTGAK